MTDDAPTLEEVRRQYLDAEQRLADIASRAQALGTVTEEVMAARTGVSEAAGELAECAAALSATTGQLGEATDALRSVDPEAIARRLEGIDASGASLMEANGEIRHRLDGLGDHLTAIDSRIRRLLVAATIAFALLATIGIIGLVT